MPAHQRPATLPHRDLAGFIDSFIRRHAPNGEGTVSVWLGDILGAPTYARDEDAQHYAASTMKLPLLVAAYRRAERREIDLDTEIPVHNQFRSAFDGSPFALRRDDDQDEETWERLGERLSVRELVRHMIVRSGNLATNLVLERVGTREVVAVLADAGCSPATVLPRGIEDTAAREAGLDNLVTAADLARVMCGIAGRTLAEDGTCEAVERVLAQQEHLDKIPPGLPSGTYVANKTGWVDGVAHDVALVRPDGTAFVLSVCTTMDVPEAEANALISEISRLIWEGRAS